MKKYISFFLSALAMVLVFSSVFSQPAQAKVQVDKVDALADSVYYNAQSEEILLNESEALEKNPNVTQVEIDAVKENLNELSKEQIDSALVDSGYDLDEVKAEDTELAAASAAPLAIPIAWKVGIAIIGLLGAGALIFTALYFNHQEKQSLIDQCYANDGYPKVDSGDSAGIGGTTDSGEAEANGGYSFECRKN